MSDQKRTYEDDAGNVRKCRRRKDRENDDPRIEHLFEGFSNVIDNADDYAKGYMKAMRDEFAQLIQSLVR